MTETAIRYEEAPVLQSVLAYGSETLVPTNDICRLSYYLKCCVVGCGINIPMEGVLLDYMNAHNIPLHLQEKIVRSAFEALSLENLINRAFILDDQHILLPQGTLNTFFEFKTASTYFSINSFTIDTGQQMHVHKVMLCTLKWMREYYIDPFIRYQQGNPLVEIHAIPVALDGEYSDYVRSRRCTQQHAVITITPVDPPETARGNIPSNCSACNQENFEGPHYRCSQCTSFEVCGQCYNTGRHDQTHSFERICSPSSAPEPLAAQVEMLNERDSFVPDVPMAIAVPMDQTSSAKSVAQAPASIIR